MSKSPHQFEATSHHTVDNYRKERAARAEILRIADPEDSYVQQAITCFGPVLTAALLTGSRTDAQSLWAQQGDTSSLSPQAFAEAISQRLDRWKKRRGGITVEQEFRFAAAVNAWLCIPEDPDWPQALEDLEPKAPFALWGRGERNKLAGITLENCVAVVGSRDTTTYGNSASTHITGELASQGYTIVSGGAFGIDAIAHRSALATATAQTPTIALMACGVDRPYPKHHEELLNTIIAEGLLLSEVPLGCSPTRWRFLQRNRLIAALSQATLVVEARWRSGALNTAHHALEIGRPLFAVPGQIFSPNSEGCHRLIRDGYATLCSTASDITSELGTLNLTELTATGSQQHNQPTITDQLTEIQARVWDALPLRSYALIDSLVGFTGAPPKNTMIALSQLSELGLATTDGVGWKKLAVSDKR